MTFEDYRQLDQILLSEVNVKELHRVLCRTEKGEIVLEFDGEDYTFTLNGEDVTTAKLYNAIPGILEDTYLHRNTTV